MALERFLPPPEQRTPATVFDYFEAMLTGPGGLRAPLDDSISPGFVRLTLPAREDAIEGTWSLDCVINISVQESFADLSLEWLPGDDHFILCYQSGADGLHAGDECAPIPPTPWIERMLIKYGRPSPWHVRTPSDKVSVTIPTEQVPNVLRDFAEYYRFCLERLDQILEGPPAQPDEAATPLLSGILEPGTPPPERIVEALARR